MILREHPETRQVINDRIRMKRERKENIIRLKELRYQRSLERVKVKSD